jgi:hypothetical protein
MSLYDTYETDPQLEKDGVHLEVGTNSKGEIVTIRVRRAGGSNQQFAKVFEFKSKPYRRLMDIPGALDPKVQERLMREVYAEAIVAGWENVEDRQGKPLPFTKDNVIQLFTDLPDLFRTVVRESQGMAMYRKEVRDAEAGN